MDPAGGSGISARPGCGSGSLDMSTSWLSCVSGIWGDGTGSHAPPEGWGTGLSVERTPLDRAAPRPARTGARPRWVAAVLCRVAHGPAAAAVGRAESGPSLSVSPPAGGDR